MTTKPTLTYFTPDSTGAIPDFKMIGKSLLHLGNGKTYMITGFAWLGELDEWGFTHVATDLNGGFTGVVLCRPLHHINGVRSNGEPRYEVLA